MDKILSKFQDDYEEIIEEETNNKYYNIFTATNKNGNLVFLKVYKTDILSEFFYKQIEREEKLVKLCKSDNIVEFYNKKEKQDDNIIIFEYEQCTKSLAKYLSENDNMKDEKEFYIKIIKDLAKAFKVLLDKQVIHRDIKPYNICIKKLNNITNDEEEIMSFDKTNSLIKLVDFGSAIEFNENDSKQIGTILYACPEILKNEKYNEKCDMWSLGITLYQLYFGITPYSLNYDLDSIIEKIYSNNFIYEFSGIPILDILFKRLLTIEPENRMGHLEFYEYVTNDNFEEYVVNDKYNSKENFIKYVLNEDNFYKKYENIYKEIRNIMETKEYKELKEEKYKEEGKEEETRLNNQINKIAKIAKMPKIMDLFSSLKNVPEINEDNKYINIIFYNEDKNYPGKEIKKLEEEKTNGAFIFCDSKEKLEIIFYEITHQIDLYKFCIITNISSSKSLINSLKKIDKNLIKYFKICIYTENNNNNVVDSQNITQDIKYISCRKDQVIENFIKKNMSKKTIPYPSTKLVTYDEYKNNPLYYYCHLIISLFYNEDLNSSTYEENLEKIKNLIDKDEKIRKTKEEKERMIESFAKFKNYDLDEGLEELDQKIIKEYTKNTFYGDLNRWLREVKILDIEEVAYFTSRLMHSLNNYGKKDSNSNYFKNNKKLLYRGIELDYSSLLAFERAKNQKIIFTAFTSMTENEKKAKEKFGNFKKKQKDRFSVIFYVTNLYETGWISNGIDIQKISERKNEQEILYQPFSFYFVENVKIDIDKYEAEIYIKTIGKEEILEERLIGKTIVYNKKKNIVELK